MLGNFFHKNISRVWRRHYSIQNAKNPRQVFSAIQPTGEAHLGNYMGALKKWVDLQNSEENHVIYAIADFHSLTIPKDPTELQKNIFVMAATVLACGIDSDKSIFFKQSDVAGHTDLCWILGTLTSVAKLTHLPQYKEKCKLVNDGPVGLFLYPVLQTADIMLYRTTHVPVGMDQVPQILAAHHLIKAFNHNFGSTFPVPEPIIDSSFGKIKSLVNPTKKMSKSDKKETSAISLMDEPDEILKKVKKALTDCKSQVTYEPEERPGISNLILIHSGLTGKTPQNIVEECVNLDTGQYKLVLADVIIEHLNPIRKKITEYLDSKDFLLSELQKGAEKARVIAEKTMEEVKGKVGVSLLKEKTVANKKQNQAAA